MLGSGYLLMKVYIVLFIYIALNHPPIVLSLPQIPFSICIYLWWVGSRSFFEDLHAACSAPVFLGRDFMMKTGTFRYYIAMIITGDSLPKDLVYHIRYPLKQRTSFQLLCCTSWLRLNLRSRLRFIGLQSSPTWSPLFSAKFLWGVAMPFR